MKPAPAIRAACLAACVLLAPPDAGRAGATGLSFVWKSAVSGTADTPTDWNPTGVPGSGDYVNFSVTGGYEVIFPGTVSSTLSHSYQGSGVNISVDFTSPHTTGSFIVNSGTPSILVHEGTLNAGTVQVGFGGSPTFGVGNGSIVHSNSQYLSGYGDVFGNSSASTVNITGGAQYYCDHVNSSSQDLVLGGTSTGQATVTVSGSQGMPASVYSGLHTTGSARMIVGSQGSATLTVSGGGYADVSGDVQVAAIGAGSSGYLNVGPTAFNVFGKSNLIARGNLWIGRNDFFTTSGHAELTIKNRSFVNAVGEVDVGTTANDASCVLRVLQGGSLLTTGGLRFYPTSGNPFDFQGGLVNVHGGALTWPSNRTLTVSSQVGTPELRLTNGGANTGPNMGNPLVTGLWLARGGTGTLRISQPGTVFNMTGTIVIAESLGAVGTMVADSSASVPLSGNVIVGNAGTGELDVRGGASMQVATAMLGTIAQSVGKVIASGQSASDITRLTVNGNLYVGGTAGGPGGTAQVVADTNASIVVLPAGGNPAAATKIFPGSTLTVADTALFRTAPGSIDDQGSIVLAEGQVECTNTLTIESNANLVGYGWVDLGPMVNSGLLSPNGANSAFGTIEMRYASYQQTAGGHYHAFLGAGLRCDTLLVHGQVSLNGALDLQLDPSFVRTAGDTFTVLVSDSVIAGTFATTTWNGNPLTGQATIVYEPHRVRVAIGAGTSGVAPGAPTALRLAPAREIGALAFTLDLPADAEVDVVLYDVSGRHVATLGAGLFAAGRHQLAAAPGLASGAYFARATVRGRDGTLVRTARAFLLR